MPSTRPNRSPSRSLPARAALATLPGLWLAGTALAQEKELIDDRPEAVRQVGQAIAAQMQLAQPQRAAAVADAAAADDGMTGRDPNEGVFVRDSALAVEKI